MLNVVDGDTLIWETGDLLAFDAERANFCGNPYVTADSVNMVGEAVVTGVPVHVYEPSGGHRKISFYIDRLSELGAVRRWNGALVSWKYDPIDATPFIAREIARRYLAR